MDESVSEALDGLAERYDQSEAEPEPETGQAQSERPPDKGAENAATISVKAFELGWRAVDARVAYGEDVYGEGREKLGPLFAKYGLGASADGLPHSEELQAGWWLGGLMKKTWLGLRELWAADRKQKEKDQHGDQRERASTESAYPVPSEIGAWEEPVPQAQSPYTEPGGEGSALGPEPGP